MGVFLFIWENCYRDGHRALDGIVTSKVPEPLGEATALLTG